MAIKNVKNYKTAIKNWPIDDSSGEKLLKNSEHALSN